MYMAGAVGIEPTSAVLETAILADELCPYMHSVSIISNTYHKIKSLFLHNSIDKKAYV